MEGKPYGAAANRVYEDIEPSAEWVREEGFDTLIVNLQGYRKENLRIQVTSTRNIRVLGERSLSHENNKWQRFRKEFPVPSNCDVNETTARFDNGMLYVKIPKTIAPVVETAPKQERPPKPMAAAPAVHTAPKEQKLPKSMTEIPNLPPPPPQKPTTTAPAAQKTNALSQEQEPPSKPLSEKQTMGDPKANNGPPEKEKVNKITSEAITDDNSKKTSTEKEQSDPMGANAKITQEKSQTEGTVMEDLKGTVASEYCRRRTQLQGRDYGRQVVDGMVMELKEPRRLLNLVLALVFLLVLGLYVKHAVNSIQEFKREEL